MGNVVTSIGFDEITVSGEFNISGTAVQRGFNCHLVVVPSIILDIICTESEPNVIFYVMGIPGDMGLFGGGSFVRSEHTSTGLTIPFSYSARGYHIERDYGIELSGTPPRGRMKPHENNPSANPTHSIEMRATDNWAVDADPGEISLSFGDIQWTGINGTNPTPPGSAWVDPEFYIEILPSSSICISFDSVWDRANSYVGCTATLSTNLTPFNFDGVGLETHVGGGDGTGVIHMDGSGNTLTWWNDADTGGGYGIGLLVPPPHAVDWSGYGLCDWREDTHNPRYDDVLVWGGFRKVPEMDGKITWPLRSETETPDPPPLSMSGDEFEYGEEVPVPLGELRALGTYVKPPKELGEPHFWGGPVVSLRVDRESHNKHNLYPKGSFEHPLRFPIGIPHLLDPMPDTNPHFLVGAIRSDVDVDIPELLDGRPSAWVSYDYSVDGGGIGSDEPVEFTVNGAGTLFREFKSNWLPRCEAFIAYANATGNWAVFPSGYFVHRANYMLETYDDWDWDDIYAKTGYREEDEDVVWWSSHRYLLLSAGGPQSADEKEVIATLDYYVESVSDDHVLDLTGPSGKRGIECSLSGPFTHEMVGIYDHSKQRIVFDLAEPLESIPDLRHVHKMTIHFDNGHVGDWVLNGLRLMHDDNEPVALVTMHEARHAYVSGGVRGVVNGLYPKALMTSGNFRTYAGQEELAELIDWNWTKTLLLMQDGSAAWRLDNFMVILSGACEGWQWSLPENWDEMVTDEDGNTLTVGYSFDLLEAQGRDIDLGYPARISAYRWQTAPQLVYKPHGVVCVQGGMHGLSDRRSSSIPMIQRKNLDMADWEDWRNDIGTDANGYFYFGDDIVAEYEDGSPVFWQYRIGKKGNVVSRVYERQWIAHYFSKAVTGGIDAMLDPWGFTWEAFTIDGSIFVRRLNRQQLTFGEPILVAQLGDDISQPAITRNHTGIIYVSVIVEGAAEPVTYISRDTAKTWEQLSSDDDGGGG